jgi:hypothetical protein
MISMMTPSCSIGPWRDRWRVNPTVEMGRDHHGRRQPQQRVVMHPVRLIPPNGDVAGVDHAGKRTEESKPRIRRCPPREIEAGPVLANEDVRLKWLSLYLRRLRQGQERGAVEEVVRPQSGANHR